MAVTVVDVEVLGVGTLRGEVVAVTVTAVVVAAVAVKSILVWT